MRVAEEPGSVVIVVLDATGRHEAEEVARAGDLARGELLAREQTGAGPPPLLLAVGGPRTADLAGRVADGMIGTDPSAGSIDRFRRAGGAGKPRYAELTVCWARSESAARRTAREIWPAAAMESSLSWEVPQPDHFEAVAELVTEDAVAESVVCGPDPERYLAGIAKYTEAGYDHVCLGRAGPGGLHAFLPA